HAPGNVLTFDFGFFGLGEGTTVSLAQSYNMDLAPGGTYPTDWILDAFNKSSLASSVGTATATFHSFCFMPTFSALSIDLPDGFDVEANYSGPTTVSPFDEVYVEPDNTSHLTFTNGALGWIGPRLNDYISDYARDCNDNGIPDRCEGITPADCFV